MIHLLFVVHHYSGAQTYANELLGFLSRQEVINVTRIHLGSLRFNEFKEVYSKDGLDIYFPRITRNSSYSNKYFARCADILYPLIIGQKIILHLNSKEQVYFAKEMRRRYDIKIILTLHYLPHYFTWLAKGEMILKNYIDSKCILDYEIIKLSDSIICVTKFAKDVVVGYFGKNRGDVHVIYNGVHEKQKIVDIADKEILKVKLGYNINEEIVLFVGRIDFGKGVENLVAAFKELISINRNTHLVFAGGGNIDKIFSLCSDILPKVTFTGEVSHERLCELYNIADFGIIPSGYEQCSFVAIEMMGFGLPIIVSQIPGLEELFIHEENALFCPVKKANNEFLEIDEKRLFQCMVRLMTNPLLKEHLTEKTMEMFKKRHIVEFMGNKTMFQYINLFAL